MKLVAILKLINEAYPRRVDAKFQLPLLGSVFAEGQTESGQHVTAAITQDGDYYILYGLLDSWKARISRSIRTFDNRSVFGSYRSRAQFLEAWGVATGAVPDEPRAIRHYVDAARL